MTLVTVACTSDDSSSPASDAGATMNGDDAALECDLTGTYAVTLTARAGTCGPVVEPSVLTVPESVTGVTMTTEMRAGHNLVTTTVLRSCSVRLTHEVASNTGLLVYRLTASDLAPTAGGLIEGQATFVRYAPTAPQVIECEGTYEMTMRAQP